MNTSISAFGFFVAIGLATGSLGVSIRVNDQGACGLDIGHFWVRFGMEGK